MDNIAEIVGRSVAVYLFMIVALRLLGKKELSQLNTSDLILILLISNSVQNAMVGQDSSLQGGIIAATCLFIMNYILKQVMFRFRKVRKVLEGDPVLLIYKGMVQEESLAKEQISFSELEEAIREHGLKDVSQVGLAMLERDGNISVVADMPAQHTYRRRRGLSKKIANKK